MDEKTREGQPSAPAKASSAPEEGQETRRSSRHYPKKHHSQRPGGYPRKNTENAAGAEKTAADNVPADENSVKNDSQKKPQRPNRDQPPKPITSSQEKALAALRQYEEARNGKNPQRKAEKSDGQRRTAQPQKEQAQPGKDVPSQKKEAPSQKKEFNQQKKDVPSQKKDASAQKQRPEKRGDRRSDENRRSAPSANEEPLPQPLQDTSSNIFAPSSVSSFDIGSFSFSAEDDSYLDKMPPDPTLDAVFGTAPETAAEEADGVEVVGVHFPQGGKVYWFGPNGIRFAKGDPVIVETARGTELGEIALGNLKVSESEIVAPLRNVIRKATPDDLKHEAANNEKCVDALRRCAEKIAKHNLDMKLVGAQYTFDNAKLIFYFTAAARVDFRELVKDLASEFHTRIELRQIGIRDEAKMLGGRGVCGRKLCCSVFLPGFAQVSVKMAKEQGLSLNSSKISGNCGRLMCCLRFEQSTYESELELMPPPESIVDTPDGRGTVTEVKPVGYVVKVKLDDKQDQPPRAYHLNDITVIKKAAYRREDDKDTGDTLPD